MEEIARRLAILFPETEVVYVKRDQMSALRSFHHWLYSRAWIDAGIFAAKFANSSAH